MIRFRFKGAREMQDKLRQIRNGAADEIGRALYQETEIETTEAKRRTPVDTGTLENSVHTEGPEIRGQRITTAIVAGGAAAPYALYVHEDLEALHPKKGQAKFIESTLNEAAPFIGERVARRIDVNRMK